MLQIVQPSTIYTDDPTKLLALCVWREARGESVGAKLGVVWTILNRCHTPDQGFKPDVSGNILHPGAFSSFLQGDPNATKYPAAFDPSWIASIEAAQSPGLLDPTNGAVFYYSPPVVAPPHAWGKVELSAKIGRLSFYKIIN